MKVANQSQQQNTSADQSHMRARRNIYYTLSYTLVLHVITWSGNQIEFLMYGFGFALDTTALWFTIPLLAIYVSSFINPIIYAIKYERFREAVKTTFPCLKTFAVREQNVTTITMAMTTSAPHVY